MFRAAGLCAAQEVICGAQKVCVPFVFRSMFVLMCHRRMTCNQATQYVTNSCD